MLKKNIKFKNLDGHEVTETHYFNMTTAELVKLKMAKGEGFEDYLTRIVDSEDGAGIIAVFDEMVGLSYGVKTADGKFVKRSEDYEAFKASEAYSEFFMELVTNANAGAAFVNAVMPADLLAKAQYMQENEKDIQDVVPAETHNVFDSPAEMSDEEMLKALGAAEVEERRTNGLSDDEIRALTPAELRTAPRPVLVRAMQLKNQK